MGIGTVKPPAVFLDRDGVINRAILRDGRPHPPASLEELEILAGVPAALRRLKEAGFRLVVVTNQPDVARGTQTRAAVEQLHGMLQATLPIDEIRVCYHDDRDRCSCRKPAPGLLLAHPAHELSRSVMVGDRWRDVEAGQRAGVRTILVGTGYDERDVSPDFRVESLAEAASTILSMNWSAG